MKILVTGSSGHLGEALMRVLHQSTHEVLGVDKIAGLFTDSVGNITNREFVAACMQEIEVVLHTATLHKPHVVTHSHQDFIDTNITGTLNLLEEAKRIGVKSFIFTSTTSTFGDALTPPVSAPAIWITETVPPIPKNIYGVTKLAAENLCQLFYRNHQLPCLILRTSRFFPEEDDKKILREAYADENIKANELLYRRVDLADVVDAHLLAIEKAPKIGFGRYIISATTPFNQEDIVQLRKDAPQVLANYYPSFKEIYHQKGWKMFLALDRVYVNELARKALGWQPKYGFQYVLDCLKANKDFRSPLSIEVGIKGYHAQKFEEGPYPV